MRSVVRRSLSDAAMAKLSELAGEVAKSNHPKDKVTSLWKHLPDEFEEIRCTLIAMAHGRARCMYCEDGQGTDIEHFWPKSVYPLRAFDWANYLWACSYCNSNAKRARFPLDATGGPLLLDPSVDEPTRHLLFLPSTGEFDALDERGSKTIEIFDLNDNATRRGLSRGRLDTLNVLVELLFDYDDYRREGHPRADVIRSTLCGQDFSSVFVWLVQVPNHREGARILGIALRAPELGPLLCEIITHHHVADWLEPAP